MAQLESVNSEEANKVNFRKNTDVLAIMLVGVFPRREISQKKKKRVADRQSHWPHLRRKLVINLARQAGRHLIMKFSVW